MATATYRDTPVTVLKAPTEGSEPWGTPNVRVWCKRHDTDAEGFITFGITARIELS